MVLVVAVSYSFGRDASLEIALRGAIVSFKCHRGAVVMKLIHCDLELPYRRDHDGCHQAGSVCIEEPVEGAPYTVVVQAALAATGRDTEKGCRVVTRPRWYCIEGSAS
jgi:hypothetical protein